MTTPNTPKFNSLITHFTQFSQVGFPRGIPEPASNWRSVLQALTQYEARVVQQAYAYLKGQKVSEAELKDVAGIDAILKSVPVATDADRDYAKKLSDYKIMIGHIVDLIEGCIQELGNPYSQN